VSLAAGDHEIRHRGGTQPIRGHRLCFQQYDAATEILADAYSAAAVSEFKVWTDTASRMRVFVDGGWVTVGDSFATAGDLGAFTAGQTKEIKIEITVPSGSGSRHEELPLNIGLGV
jgi:hypothetical protein